MLDKDAIEALQEGKSIENAYKAMAKATDTNHIVMLPDNFTAHDLEKYQPVRRRARGVMATQDIDSFAVYATAHSESGATVFVSPEDMSATAILNLGTPESPGHTDSKARLTLRKTAAYKALLKAISGRLTQSDLAEFLEDWPDLITCFHQEEKLSTPKAIAAVRKITIESMRKLETEEQQLSASRSAFESVQATSTEKLPTLIYFECLPYMGLKQRLFVLRLSIHTGESKPALSLRIIKAEQHEEEMAQELASLVASSFKDNLQVCIGTYQLGQ